MAKKNPLLEAYRAKLEAEHRAKREAMNEITLMSCVLAAHEIFQCGPGRAAKFIHSFVAWKYKIAKSLESDVGSSWKKNGDGDREFLHTRKELAESLQRIFGLDGWLACREFFPMLSEFWDWRVDR